MQEIVKNKIKKKPGWEPLDRLVEECVELIVAIKKHNRWCNKETRENLKEEMSDVIFNIIGYCEMMEIPLTDLDIIAEDKTIKRFPEEISG